MNRARNTDVASTPLGERGSLLIVSLLVLLALASVAMVAVQKISIEQGYAGNERRGAVAYHITESGAYTSLAYADSLGPAGFLAMLEASAIKGGGPGQPSTLTAADLAPGVTYFDMGESGSFGYEGASQQELLTSQGLSGSPVEFKVTVSPSGMLQPLVGYSLTGPGARCRFKYQFDTDGNVGVGQGKDTGQTFNAWKRIRALMNIGPLPCDQAAARLGII